MAVHGTLERPRTRTKLIALLATGELMESAATQLGVTVQAVSLFARRHESEIADLRAQLVKAVEDYAIAQRVERIAAMEERWQLGRQVIRERAQAYGDAPGGKTGLLVHQYKETKRGDLLDEYKVDTGLLAELRAIERAAAEELGQIERPAQVHNTQINQFLIRQYEVEPDALPSGDTPEPPKLG